MELLVCNKIINLDLSVKAVFKKVWLLTQSNPGNIMKIVYRMRGLLGEATEDIIDHLTCEPEVIDNEEKFKVFFCYDIKLFNYVWNLSNTNLLNLNE